MSKIPAKKKSELQLNMLEQSELILKHADATLDESESWYRTILETINEGVILQSASGKIIAWNKKATESRMVLIVEGQTTILDIQMEIEK